MKPIQLRLEIWAAIGAVLGILAGMWIITPKHSVEELAVLEQDRLTQMREELDAQDREDMQGACEEKSIKALRSDLIASCKGGKWVRPGIDRGAGGKPTPLGLLGDDGVIRQVPGFCGPLAHTIVHSEYGLLCVQNEGEWKVASTTSEPAGQPCTTAQNGGGFVICPQGRWN